MSEAPAGEPGRADAPSLDIAMGAIAAALPAALAWRAGQQFGFGLTPDSLSFLSAARSLLDGQGMIDVDGRPFTLWPPLLPLVLAGLGALGIDPIVAGRGIGIASAAAIGVLSWAWLRPRVASRPIALAGAVGVGCCGAVLTAASHLWSDAPFAALCLASVLAVERALATPHMRALLVAAAWAAAAVATRHLGICAVLAGAAAIALHTPSAWGRWRRAAWFAALGAAPLIAWSAVVWGITGAVAGRRFASPVSPLVNAVDLTRGALKWLVPWHMTIEVQAAIGMGLLAFLLWRAIRAGAMEGPTRTPMALFAVSYSGGIVAAASIYWMDPLYQRLGMPAVVAGLLLGLSLLTPGSPARPAASVRAAGRWGTVLLVTGCLLWAARIVDLGVRAAYRQAAGGAGFTTHEWRHSALLDTLRTHPPSGALLSNEPALVYWASGRRPARAPRLGGGSRERYARWIHDLSDRPPATLVWFDRGGEGELVDRTALRASFGSGAVHLLADGALVRVGARRAN